jgi:hypothetical protein
VEILTLSWIAFAHVFSSAAVPDRILLAFLGLLGPWSVDSGREIVERAMAAALCWLDKKTAQNRKVLFAPTGPQNAPAALKTTRAVTMLLMEISGNYTGSSGDFQKSRDSICGLSSFQSVLLKEAGTHNLLLVSLACQTAVRWERVLFSYSELGESLGQEPGKELRGRVAGRDSKHVGIVVTKALGKQLSADNGYGWKIWPEFVFHWRNLRDVKDTETPLVNRAVQDELRDFAFGAEAILKMSPGLIANRDCRMSLIDQGAARLLFYGAVTCFMVREHCDPGTWNVPVADHPSEMFENLPLCKRMRLDRVNT